ncbi:MAG: TetR family transcriptional regulator C-terminal domain-containing protein, partial [Actinomycetota bacterium]
KVDLFLAVLEASIDERAATLEEAAGRAHGPADMQRVALAQAVASLAWQATLIEFRVHASRHPEINARYLVLHQRTIDNVARLVSAVAPDAGLEPRELALGLLAGSIGITLEVLADPALDPEDMRHALAQVAIVEAREATR